MSVKVAKSRFIDFSLQKFGALYQHLLHGISDFQKLGNRLVQEASTATAYRDTNKLEEVGLILSNLPIREYRLIGQYYQGWADYLKGEATSSIFEKVAEQSKTYKAKAFISLAAIAARRGDFESEYKWFIEALKYSNNPTTTVEALRAMAVVKAKEGFNKQALSDLENMAPLVRYGGLRACHDYLNSFAVELGEAGRVNEAQDICKVILASPYLFAYPEWRETDREVALRGYKSRSSVPIIRKIPVVRKVRENVLYMSEHERSEGQKPSPFDFPRDVSTLADWKKKMGKEPNGNGEKKHENMTSRDMVIKLMNLTTEEGISDEKLRKILDYVEKILSEPD